MKGHDILSQFTNRTIVNLHLEDDKYLLDIAIEKSFLEEWDLYFFSIYQRHTNKFEVLPHLLKDETDIYFIFHLEISFNEYKRFFIEGEIVDLSFVRKRGEEEKRTRVKSNYNYPELHWIQIDQTQLLHPSTTRQGNLSFYLRESFLEAFFEEIDLTDEGVLALRGLYHPHQISFDKIRNVELVVTSNLNNDIVRIPVTPKELPSSYEIYPWYSELKQNGFSAVIDLRQYLSLGKPQYLKFHLCVGYEVNQQLEVIESNRMKVNHLNQKYPIRRKLKINTNKFKIIVRETSKAKYLSLRVAEYKLPHEVIRGIKNNWVQLRRSKRLLTMYKIAFYIVGMIVPVDRKLVMFESFHGKQFSDNPRALYEYMNEAEMDYQLIWSVDRRHVNEFKNKDVEYVRRFSIRWLLLMTRAKFWVTNARLPLWIPKPKHTTYLQTWHGTPLKRLAADMEEVHMPGTNTEKYKENFTKESGKWDYLISPNRYSSKIFRRAFRFDQEMIESGYPRNDYLYTHNRLEFINHLKAALDIDTDKKVILYAPTWRDNQFYGRGRYKFNLELDLERLKEQFGDTHVIALRMHYLVAENLDLTAYKGFVYDFSTHEDIRDLYLISDILITDYSSVFFDYANLRRPIIFFVYDIDDYRDNLRGFYFDLEKDAPGPLTKTTDEVIAEIQQLDNDGFTPSARYEAFYERFCYLEDGHAAKRVVNEIFIDQTED